MSGPHPAIGALLNEIDQGGPVEVILYSRIIDPADTDEPSGFLPVGVPVVVPPGLAKRLLLCNLGQAPETLGGTAEVCRCDFRDDALQQKIQEALLEVGSRD